MFHLKFSRKDDYVHEHELYEVMRSRNLYQTQFGLRSNFQKTMRNIAKDEKQRKYNFENTRKIFVQKMKVRREQVDKLRKRLSVSINSLSNIDDTPKPERRYLALPRSTIVYTDLLDEITQPLVSDAANSAAPSPSMVATNYSGPIEAILHKTEFPSVSPNNEQPRPKSLPAKYLVVGKGSPRTRTAKTKCPKMSVPDDKSESSERIEQTADLVNELKALTFENKSNEEKNDDDFEKKAKLGQGKAQESTVYFPNEPNTKRKIDFKKQILESQSKAKEWAEKHGISKSKVIIQKEQDFQRLMIDRPSKWALDHVHPDHGDNTQSKIFDVRLQYNRRLFDESFKRKARKLDSLSEKLKLKQRISLPELDTTPKPMVTLNPGGTTPDGRLILTKADYEEYLSNYRKARECRLEQSKKKNKYLDKRVENFSVDPQLCLRDETCLRTSLRTI